MDNKIYLYDDEYWTLEELYDMYKKLDLEQKKPFRDSLAHFGLAEILKKCNYDNRIIDLILELARIEAAKINLYGSDCGRVLLSLGKAYKKELRKLINLTGKLANDDDIRMNIFGNGEWLLKHLVNLTIGSSFEMDNYEDLYVIDYNQFSEDDCLAIANNFICYMRGEELVYYDKSKHLCK